MGQGFIRRRRKKPEKPNPYEQLVNYTMLYDYGNECTDITGGWNYYGYYNNSDSKGMTFSTKTFTKKSDCLYFSGTGTRNKNCEGIILSANTINFSGYSAMFIKSSVVSAGIRVGGQYGFFPSGTTALKTFWDSSPFYLYETDTSGSRILGEPVRTDAISINTPYRSAIAFGSWGYNGTIAMNIYNITIFKPDNWSELASIVGVSASSISVLLSSASKILSNEDAVNYLVAQCTGDFMASAIQNSTFLTALTNSPYKERVYANEHWAKFLGMIA